MKQFQLIVCALAIVLFYSCNTKNNKETETAAEKISTSLLVLTERGGQHGGFTDAGLKWLNEQASAMNFEFTEINNTSLVNEEYLAQFDAIIQLDYPPYSWTEDAERAFIKYIEEGLGGWIGFHHATLLGEFDGYPMWKWFSDFMGGIRFQNYIAALTDGTVQVEDKTHPVMQGVSESFLIPDDEWYTFDKNPRPNVHVLATVDESSYQPDSDIKMGDHPVVWVNPHKKARNVYFLIGHSSKLYENRNFTAMFGNAIRWAAGME
jgi:chitinase